MADNTPKKAFVIGHPIAHSRSPMIHRHWLSTSGIAGTYESIDVAPAQLPDFVRDIQRNGFVGGNVTIPHKEAVLGLVGKLDQAAELIGAVNTLWIENGTIHGGNTDAAGFSANLDQCAPQWREARSALVLGAGGAARAIVHALVQGGIREIRLVNRTLSRAQELADRFGAGITAHDWASIAELAPDTDLVVNTTSLGMHGEGGHIVDMALLPDNAIVTDIVYVPLHTPLLEQAAARGLRVVDGLGMLLHQAAPGFERWFGRRPAVTPELRDIVIADLETA